MSDFVSVTVPLTDAPGVSTTDTGSSLNRATDSGERVEPMPWLTGWEEPNRPNTPPTTSATSGSPVTLLTLAGLRKPSVMVPVLSTTSESAVANRSSATAPDDRIIPLRLHALRAAACATGAAASSAHGDAATSTDSPMYTEDAASATADDPTRTAAVYQGVNRSIAEATDGLDRAAACVSETMRWSVDSVASRVVSSSIACVHLLMAPAGIEEDGNVSTMAGSPVMWDTWMDAGARPSTIPSIGQTEFGRTRIVDPTGTVCGCMSVILPPGEMTRTLSGRILTSRSTSRVARFWTLC